VPKKKVVYLFGAGASHAVIKHANPEKGLMTADIQRQIELKYSDKKKGVDLRIWNELITTSDIEHLISVLESQYNYSSTDRIRKYYRDALVELAREFSKAPPRINLYTVLYDLHENVTDLQEELLCFITLNYEDLLERSLRTHLKYNADYAIKTTVGNTVGNTVEILKLHGSFNWSNRRPIQIRKMTAIPSGNTLWIPPGVEKRKENYPFNVLWGKASECLIDCDVIRVIGCSLSRNDWGLVPMLYTAQKFNEQGRDIEIEVIDFLQTGRDIKNNYQYLNVKDITEIEEIISFYKRQFPHASNEEIKKEMVNQFSDKDIMNPFQMWLDAKIDFLLNVNELNINTRKRYVHNFYYKV
jgi:hypothetical protein